MLDYKIKELKKQIEPRENDIKAMKEQIQEVRTVRQIKHAFVSNLKKATIPETILKYLPGKIDGGKS